MHVRQWTHRRGMEQGKHDIPKSLVIVYETTGPVCTFFHVLSRSTCVGNSISVAIHGPYRDSCTDNLACMGFVDDRKATTAMVSWPNDMDKVLCSMVQYMVAQTMSFTAWATSLRCNGRMSHLTTMSDWETSLTRLLGAALGNECLLWESGPGDTYHWLTSLSSSLIPNSTHEW